MTLHQVVLSCLVTLQGVIKRQQNVSVARFYSMKYRLGFNLHRLLDTLFVLCNICQVISHIYSTYQGRSERERERENKKYWYTEILFIGKYCDFIYVCQNILNMHVCVSIYVYSFALLHVSAFVHCGSSWVGQCVCVYMSVCACVFVCVWLPLCV